jgi:hypothetical protein
VRGTVAKRLRRDTQVAHLHRATKYAEMPDHHRLARHGQRLILPERWRAQYQASKRAWKAARMVLGLAGISR